ncbi:hypothetical protein R1flu_020200 [Riccia fluitans]|uniref:B-block binding subunit of TFIIIC domain-containing protein n=1 Tax=Riccia fluitans TaxID=41844 RepID=A0ABD1ZLZ7_9MARC
MDALVSAALQELAVEGSEGCTLPKLWSLIHDAATEARINLAGRPKQYLWQELLIVPGIVLSLPKSVSIAVSDPRVQPVESAEKLGVQIVASEALRDGSLGLYDLKVCDARLSKEQRDILERIAKSRTNGITQSQLSKEFKVTGNKIFYLVKMLESRGLVVRQTTLVRTEESKTPIVATNLLHLTRYAKDLTLSSHQRFEILRKSKDDNVEAGDLLGDDGEGDELGPKTKGGDFVIQDDFPAMEKICQKLEETEDKVLVVGDLKGSLGYRQAVGHRTWRRLMKRLQDAGVVEVFNAQIDRKIRPCVRLLKSFDMKALSGANEETEGDNTVKRGKITDMVMELSIDQQIYHLVDQSGSDGVQMMEVFNRLGLQNKRNYCRVATMLARQCLVSEAENHKRSTLYRLKTGDRASGGAAAPLMSRNDSGEGSPKVPAIMSREDTEHASVAAPADPQTSGFIMYNDHALQAERSTSAVPSPVTDLQRQETESRSSRKQPGIAQDIGGRKVREKDRKELLLLNRDILASEKESGSYNNALSVVEHPSSVISSPVEQVPPTRTTQNHSGVQVPTTTRAQREQRILEKLQAERFVLRVELHRWLEDIENRKDTMMDRKTLSRILQAFQRDGRCKCVLLSMPGLTNCGRQRTVEVVLLPSVTVDEKVLNEVHEKVRKFDMDCRGYGQSRARKKDDVPVLDGVKRMRSNIPRMKHRVTKFDTVKNGSWSMQANGFINAKMVRVSMLHHFLWSYITSYSDESQVYGGFRQPDGTLGGLRTFSLASAVKKMPLELFLQIIGSVHRVEDSTTWCEKGLRLCDLPTQAFSLFLDVGATGRLSWLVDVLRRLKLVRLVMGGHQQLLDCQQDLRNCSLAAVLTYAMESEPYLEEPAPSPLPSFNLDNYDTSPRARHEFSISTKDGQDAYWQTLEYFYSGAQPAVARHSFPGSSVPELFGLRSWTTVRVMSTEQRHELLKRIGAGGMDKRKSAQECAQIAKDLNLSLYQVLRVSYEKNRIYRLQKLAKTGQTQVPKKRNTNSGNSVKSCHSKAYRKLMIDVDEAREQSDKVKPHSVVDGVEDGKEGEDDEDTEGIQNEFSFVADLRPSRPPRARRIVWSEGWDRQLISAYAKQRAKLGAGFPRVDWNTMENLPTAPAACRRRMAMMRSDIVTRKAILSLCSLIAARYVRHLESHRAQAGVTTDSSAGAAAEPLGREQMHSHVDMHSNNQVNAGVQPETENIANDYSWDDMTEPFLAAALDEIVRCRKAAKSTGSKRSAPLATRKSKCSNPEATLEPEDNAELVEDTCRRDIAESSSQNMSDPHKGHVAFAVARVMSSSWPSSAEKDVSRLNSADPRESHTGDEDTTVTHLGGPPLARFTTAAGPSRRMRKSAPKLLRKPSVDSGLSTEQQVRKSIGVANAVEIVKLVLLNSMQEKELVGPLVEAVQRFREDEVFTAVKYLREQGLLMAGQGAQTFVLSSKYFHDCAASRFPVGAGHQWHRSVQWVSENLEKMEEDWVSVPTQQQENQLAHLLSLVSTGEFAFNPSLPAKDIGETEERTVRRPGSHRPSAVQGEDATGGERHMVQTPASKYWTCERRERGFPGVEVSLMRSNRTLPCILSKYCSSKNLEGPSIPASDRLSLELTTSDFQDYSPMIIEQAGPVNLDCDTPEPGLNGEKDYTSMADGGCSSNKHCENECNQTLPAGYDGSSQVATKRRQVMDPSAANTRAEGYIDVGQESDGSLHRTEGNEMRNDRQGTTGEECDGQELTAAGREGAVVNNFQAGDDLLQARQTSRTESKDTIKSHKTIPEQLGRKATFTSQEDLSVSGSLTRVSTTLSREEMMRSDSSLDAEVNAENKLTIMGTARFKEPASAGAFTRISALEEPVRFFSRTKADSKIDRVRHLDSELLRYVYHAVEQAGAEGLALETLQEDLQNNGVDVGGRLRVAADFVEVLESFGLVKRINAFDHVRVLEFSHAKRFFINPKPSNGNCRKRKFGSETDILDTTGKRQKNFSSDIIERAGRFDSMDRRRMDQTTGYTAGSSRTGEHRVISLRRNYEGEEDDSSVEFVGIVPWLDRHGSLHPSMMRSLSRRVMGIVVGHPGISEDMLVGQLKVLNPQSGRQLLQFLEADGHLLSRLVMQHKVEVPRLLQKLVKENRSSLDCRYVKHYFSNPMSGGLL